MYQEPYSSIDKSLVEESTFNNFAVKKYNDNYFIQDKEINIKNKTFFNALDSTFHNITNTIESKIKKV